MLELLFIVGFFAMLLVTGISLMGIIVAMVVAAIVMFIGSLFALMLKLLPWLLLAVAAVWMIKKMKRSEMPQFRRYKHRRY